MAKHQLDPKQIAAIAAIAPRAAPFLNQEVEIQARNINNPIIGRLTSMNETGLHIQINDENNVAVSYSDVIDIKKFIRASMDDFSETTFTANKLKPPVTNKP